MRSVLITTEYRGVFFGLVSDDADLTQRTLTNIKSCRMAINWRNGKGVQGLASDGPDNQCKIGSASDVEVMHGVTAVFTVTEEACKKWMAA